MDWLAVYLAIGAAVGFLAGLLGIGGGMVTVRLNGKSEMRGVSIDPSLADDVEVLEDLIVAAYNDAKVKVEARVQEEMSKLTGGLELPPGFKMPFG